MYWFLTQHDVGISPASSSEELHESYWDTSKPTTKVKNPKNWRGKPRVLSPYIIWWYMMVKTYGFGYISPHTIQDTGKNGAKEGFQKKPRA